MSERHYVLRGWPMVDVAETGEETVLILTDASGAVTQLRVSGNATVELDADPAPLGATMAIMAGTPEPKES